MVTGANRGIGLGICMHLSAKGATIVAVVRSSSPKLDAVALNGGKIIEGIDMMDDDCSDKLKAALGDMTLDCVLANAGVLHRDESVLNMDFDLARKTYEINALGPLKVVRGTAHAIKDNTGRIFVMTSLMGSIGS